MANANLKHNSCQTLLYRTNICFQTAIQKSYYITNELLQWKEMSVYCGAAFNTSIFH